MLWELSLLLHEPCHNLGLGLTLVLGSVGSDVFGGVICQHQKVFSSMLSLDVHGPHEVHVDEVQRLKRLIQWLNTRSESTALQLPKGVDRAILQVTPLVCDLEVQDHVLGEVVNVLS
jgi:hypothetical protein